MTSANRQPLHFSNAHWYEDRISVAADPALLRSNVNGGVYVDRQFGNAWSWTPPPGAAVYGRSAAVPHGPLDIGQAVFRAPFRRIPIIELRSLNELLSFSAGDVAKDPQVTKMWRGQPRHYTLEREPSDKLRLYGELDADEPSLLPSAARQSLYFPDIAEAWTGLLDLYIEERLNVLVAIEQEPRRAQLRREAENFISGYNYRGWAWATAQHYGLPSVGLDLTSDINIALYFALHKFKIDPDTGVMSVRRAIDEDDPIIYGLDVFAHDLVEDDKLAPAWLSCARPRAQKAYFFGSAWGDSVNRAAERVYVAVRLKDHANWDCPISTADAFPSTSTDEFLLFLLKARERRYHPLINDLLRRVYFTAG
nr:FRG domain-containing protein [Methylobacterium sp. OTU13CASTA1]